MALRQLGIDRADLLRALTARGEGLLGTWLDLREGTLRPLREPDHEGFEDRLEAEADHWVKVPLFSREFRLMAEFVELVDDDDLAVRLDAALSGPAAFREWDRVLGGWPQEQARWREHREAALVRWGLSWLRGLGLSPAWAGAPAEGPVEVPTLLALLVDEVGRSRSFPTEAAAQAAFVRASRDLCELLREPFPARRVRSGARFVRGPVEIVRDRRLVTIRLRGGEEPG